MKFIEQSVEVDPYNLTEEQILAKLASVVGTPYAKGIFTPEKAVDVIAACIRRGHTSVLEHCEITLNCITNIETYKDYTRHRHCAFTIESTSFVKYPEFTFIVTPELEQNILGHKEVLETYETFYKAMLVQFGPKKARDLLPQSQAAKMIITTNIRQWRFILGLRSDPNDNPLTIELRNLMFNALNKRYPLLFPYDETAAFAIPAQYRRL